MTPPQQGGLANYLLVGFGVQTRSRFNIALVSWWEVFGENDAGLGEGGGGEMLIRPDERAVGEGDALAVIIVDGGIYVGRTA